MPKILILADLHLHPFEEFAQAMNFQGLNLNSRLADMMTVLYRIGQGAKDKGVTHCIIAGDVFHRRTSVPTEARQVFYDWLVWMRDSLKITTAIITGNHDQLDKSGTVHSLYDLKDACQVIDTPLKEEFGGANVVFLPFMESKADNLHCLQQLDLSLEDDEKPDLLIAHIGIEGAFVGPVEYKIKSPITFKDLGAERFHWVLLGHYHKPQQIGKNGFYIGSPWQINRGERGEIKRWLLYDTNTKKLTSVPTGAKEFKVISATELASATSLPGNYYDVLSEPGVDINEKLTQYQVKVIRPKVTAVHDARIKLHEDMSDEQLVTAYCFHKEVSPKWAAIGLQILNQVSQENHTCTKIKFKQLAITNFMSISEAKLSLNRPGSVTAVLGDNRDRPGFISNGSGKSAILPEAIFWCLFGKTARKLPADKVVNRKAKRNCSVTVHVELDNSQYKVVRYRKHTKFGGTGLQLWQDGKDISGGTAELTEEKLKVQLGIDFITFSSVLAFSPDNLRFVNSTDANQKQVLDSILQTRRFTAALAVTKSIRSDINLSKLSAISEKSEGVSVLTYLSENLKTYETRNSEWEARESLRVRHLEGVLATYANQRSSLEANLASAVDDLLDQEEQIKAIDVPDIEPLITEHDKAWIRTVEEKALLQSLEIDAAKIQGKLDSAVDQAGKPCSTCGQKVSNTGALIAKFQKDRNDIVSSIENKRKELLNFEEAHKAASLCLFTAQGIVNDLKARKLSYANQKMAVVHYNSKIAEIDSHKLNIERTISDVPANEYDKLIPDLQADVERRRIVDSNFTAAIAMMEKQLARLDFWMTAFGPGGVRSFLLDQILPDLTRYANEFSDNLSGGGITISFESFNEDTLKDKFKIRAVNEDGSDVYEGNSSGEKRRIDICVMFSLFRIANKKTSVNILLLDEVLDTLDGSGLENVVDVLHKLAQELHLGIYVTSHTSLNSMLHDSITLEKHRGQTVLQKET